MKFTEKDVEKLARLARISLTKEEKKKFGQQIASILDYVKQIQEVDTAGIVSMDTNHQGLKNVFRQDEKRNFDANKKIIDQFPEKYGNLNKVKPVL